MHQICKVIMKKVDKALLYFWMMFWLDLVYPLCVSYNVIKP